MTTSGDHDQAGEQPHADDRVRIVRVYEEATPDDGKRVLVDRLWPRGVSKDDAALDDWPKDLAPSTDLRRWYDHDPDKFDEFRRRYLDELDDPERRSGLDDLVAAARDHGLTLLTATRDVDHAQAAVLATLVRSRLADDDPPA